MTAWPTARPVQAKARRQTITPRRGRATASIRERAHGVSASFVRQDRWRSLLEIRNPAGDEPDLREGARGQARGPRLRPDLHRSHGGGPLYQAKGWHGARVESRANFPLDPATAVLHYAQEIFEGLKAYKRDDGGVNLFRPDANARRFRNSAERMAMAPVPEPVFIEAVEQLVRIDRPGYRAARAVSTCGPS